MLRFLVIVVTLLTIVLITGCSVFGVATRNDLDAALLREQAARQQTDARLETLGQRLQLVAADLDDLDRRLRPRLASLDSALIRTSAEVALVTERWDELRDDLTADLDSLSAGYGAVLVEVDVVRGDLDELGGEARSAQDRSRQAMRIHHDTLLSEHERLQRRLLDLEARLRELDAAADSNLYDLGFMPGKEGTTAPAGSRGGGRGRAVAFR